MNILTRKWKAAQNIFYSRLLLAMFPCPELWHKVSLEQILMVAQCKKSEIKKKITGVIHVMVFENCLHLHFIQFGLLHIFFVWCYFSRFDLHKLKIMLIFFNFDFWYMPESGWTFAKNNITWKKCVLQYIFAKTVWSSLKPPGAYFMGALKRFRPNTSVLEDFYIALKTRQTDFRTLIPF